MFLYVCTYKTERRIMARLLLHPGRSLSMKLLLGVTILVIFSSSAIASSKNAIFLDKKQQQAIDEVGEEEGDQRDLLNKATAYLPPTSKDCTKCFACQDSLTSTSSKKVSQGDSTQKQDIEFLLSLTGLVALHGPARSS